MRFPPAFLDEIKARLPASQVAGRRVRLKKQGREWRGLSPFTAEKTPSFYVNDQKMRWFDFSAGKSGNIFDFLMETEGLTFPEAVERLAGEAGLSLPTLSREDIRREETRASAQHALELAAAFFEAQLHGADGARARGYLAGRRLGGALQKEFRIGYAPRARHALRDHLAARDVGLDVMIEAGLLVHGPDIPVAYDRFRDRVMFPICDRSGKVIAFGGRAMEQDAQAKYLNSPETALFHKGACLYNHHRARLAAHKADRVIAVEGYIDVIALHGAGVAETVAPLGTALTPEQCALLWRMADEPILCFDGDRAGRKAAFRAVETALPLIGPGKSLRFAFMPEGQDPDDLVKTAGAAAVDEVLAAARPLVDVLWTREAEVQPLDTPERRAAFERRLHEALRPIPDDGLRRLYRQEMGARLSALFGRDRRDEGWAGRRSGGRASWNAASPSRNAAWNAPWRAGQAGRGPLTVSAALAASPLFSGRGRAMAPREAFILLIVVNHPSLAAAHAEDLAELELESPDLARLRDVVLHAVAEGGAAADDLRGALAQAGSTALLTALEAATPPNWCAAPAASPLDAAAALRQALALHRRARALHREMRAAEAALAADDHADEQTDEKERTFARLRDIQAQLSALEGAEAAIEGFGEPSGRQTGHV